MEDKDHNWFAYLIFCSGFFITFALAFDDYIQNPYPFIAIGVIGFAISSLAIAAEALYKDAIRAFPFHMNSYLRRVILTRLRPTLTFWIAVTGYVFVSIILLGVAIILLFLN